MPTKGNRNHEAEVPQPFICNNNNLIYLLELLETPQPLSDLFLRDIQVILLGPEKGDKLQPDYQSHPIVDQWDQTDHQWLLLCPLLVLGLIQVPKLFFLKA